jgi:hypothetical protein
MTNLKAKDFKTDQEVRWCPGCGDYAILAALQSFMPELGVPRENIVFISGIGCAARFPTTWRRTGCTRSTAARRRSRRDCRSRARPLGVGRHRRRRRALDRRQPPDPRAAPQREPEDPALQQPDLRADEGAVLADVAARDDHEVDAARLARRPFNPISLAIGARRRSSRARSTPIART